MDSCGSAEINAPLYWSPATDLVTFVGVSGLLIAIALVACFVRRATRIDPIATLRAE